MIAEDLDARRLHELLQDFCPGCQGEEMASMPQAAFASSKIKQRDAARKFLESTQMDISPNYNDKYMNSIWGQYNRYSVHNLKKIMDNTTNILVFSMQTEYELKLPWPVNSCVM
ncbi:unnamed protein product [Acanthoscelides obtectus]|uniref:Uncharacterized protein n=1 Tax=Acanthoscelides obtectus TaxID=200917 RepID=A0A9P0M9N6_ACAOB|nr:unnamed protein product [Acanthoscelides obtectus]CAK1633579.1 hypothetical protein AOBTE_LOCUS8235 [Acanthoscelides obtectus]